MNALKVDAIWTSGAVHTTGVFERFVDAIDAHQIPYFEAAQNVADIAKRIINEESSSDERKVS